MCNDSNDPSRPWAKGGCVGGPGGGAYLRITLKGKGQPSNQDCWDAFWDLLNNCASTILGYHSGTVETEKAKYFLHDCAKADC